MHYSAFCLLCGQLKCTRELLDTGISEGYSTYFHLSYLLCKSKTVLVSCSLGKIHRLYSFGWLLTDGETSEWYTKWFDLQKSDWIVSFFHIITNLNHWEYDRKYGKSEMNFFLNQMVTNFAYLGSIIHQCSVMLTTIWLLAKGTVPHFGKLAYLLSCWELDEKKDTTLM